MLFALVRDFRLRSTAHLFDVSFDMCLSCVLQFRFLLMCLFNFVCQGNDSVEAIVQFMLDEQDKLLKTKGDTKADKTLKPKEEVPSTSGKLIIAWFFITLNLFYLTLVITGP